MSTLSPEQISFLENLCNAQSPSGAEIPGQKLAAEYIRDYADSVTLDPMGNLIAVVNPTAPYRVMIDAHADEIGLIIHYIDDKGFLYFSAVGGINRQLLPGERIIVNGPKGPVSGVIGRKAIHVMSAKERDSGVGEITDLWLDIGASSREEAEAVAPIGSFATVDSQWRRLLGDRVAARAFDNRCGVFVIMEALRRLRGRKLSVACYFVATVQEELGCLGAATAAFDIKPQAGICVDVTFASDHPQCKLPAQGDIRLDAGPVLGVGPCYDPSLVSAIRAAASAGNIATQTQVRPRGNGTNALNMRQSRSGVPVAQVSIPLRYMHSGVEVVSLSDLENTAQMIADTLASLPEQPEFGFRL